MKKILLFLISASLMSIINMDSMNIAYANGSSLASFPGPWSLVRCPHCRAFSRPGKVCEHCHAPLR